MAYSVFYIVIADFDGEDIDIDGPYFGGIVCEEENARKLSRSLTNDKVLPGVVMTKIFRTGTIREMKSMAHKQFNQLADDMMEAHQTHLRTRRRKY